MRLSPALALLLLVPAAVAVGPLFPADPAGDERLMPQLGLGDLPVGEAAPVPGACHAPGVDLRGIEVRGDEETFEVAMRIEDASSRAFGCNGALEGAIGEPRYSANFYESYLTLGAHDTPYIMLDNGPGIRCFAFFESPTFTFFFPVWCGFEVVGNEAIWRMPREDVDWLPLDDLRGVGRVSADVLDQPLIIEDFAG